MLRHAEAIVARLQAAQADAAAIVEGTLGALRVGTYQSVGERILPALVPRFQATHPGVEINLVESESDDELLDLVERGDLDLVFGLLPLPDGPFAWVELMRDPWMVLVEADSSLARRDGSVTLREVASSPLIGARLRRCRMQVDAHFRARGLEPRYVMRSDENGTVHALVAAGVGIGIVARLASTRTTNVWSPSSSSRESRLGRSPSPGTETATGRAQPMSSSRWPLRGRQQRRAARLVAARKRAYGGYELTLRARTSALGARKQPKRESRRGAELEAMIETRGASL
jgi:DNA-binding transcriptional LysR family regulator